MTMTREEKDKIARNAASTYCRCFECDGIYKRCNKKTFETCNKWFDGYNTAMIALADIH